MNRIDPTTRFTAAEIAAHEAAAPSAAASEGLRETARRIAQQYRQDSLSPVMVSGSMRLIEFALLMLSGFVVFGLYDPISTLDIWLYAGMITAASLLAVLLLEITDCYQVPSLRRPGRALTRIVLVWAATLSVATLVVFFMKLSAEFSRVWLAAWYFSGLGALVLFRIATARLVRNWARNGRMERRAVIVGGGQGAESLIRQIEAQPDNDIRICGIFDDRDDRRSPPIVAGYPKLGSIDALVEFARIARIDMLIVSLPLTAEQRVLTLLKKLWVLPVDIRLSAHANEMRFRPRAYSYIGKVPMLDIFDKPINDWDSVAKRAFDIVFSLFGIIVFSPVMAATAIAIKLESKGPVIFRQNRHGFNNEVIEVFKFRSMYTEMCDPTAKQAVVKDDPRVTRVGRFIRKTSIDELPQFFNVLRGDLSLVGPRPHATSAQTRDMLYTEVVDTYFARHRVKPGVTGWAQISGWRGEIDSEDKIRRRTEYDLYYIENWSLWFDVKILFLTPIRLLRSENAY
jgi:Undecaprenyl-phosphate glucose phosphotransferase